MGRVYRLTWLLIGLLIGIAYGPNLENDFVLDDLVMFQADAPQSLADAPRLLYTPVWHRNMSYFRPLTFASFTLDHALWYRNPIGYHATNLALAILSAWIFYRLLQYILPKNVALLAIGLWAAFPGHAEAILGIYNRSQMLAAGLIGLALYNLTMIWQPTRWNRAWAFAYGLATFLGLLAKESAIVVPGLGLLWIVWHRPERKCWPMLLLAFVWQSIFILVYLAFRYHALGTLGVPDVDAFVPEPGLLPKYLEHSRIFFEYIRLMVFPYPLSPDYPLVPTSQHITAFQYAAAWIFPICLGLASLSLFSTRQAWRLGGFCFFWFWINLLPVLHWTPLQIALAERLLYPASLGFCILLGFWAIRFRFISTVAALALCCIYLWATLSYGRIWQSNDALWTHTFQIFPTSYRAQIYQANVAARSQDWQTALDHYQRALSHHPNRTNLCLVYANQAQIYLELQEFEKAQALLFPILELFPEDRTANLMLGDLAMLHHDYRSALAYYKTIAFARNIWDREYASIMDRVQFCYQKIRQP